MFQFSLVLSESKIMCILFVSIHPLIFCSNRDEFTERETLVAQSKNFPGNVFAGLDLLAGGTWLGVDIKTSKKCHVLFILLVPFFFTLYIFFLYIYLLVKFFFFSFVADIPQFKSQKDLQQY